VKQLVTEYENKIIQPPPQFGDPLPAPRNKIIPLPPQFRGPVPAPRSKITKLNKALKGAVKSYEVDIKNQKHPLGQLNGANKWIKTYLKCLNEMKGLKLVETLKTRRSVRSYNRTFKI